MTEDKIDLEARVRDLAFSEEGLKKQIGSLKKKKNCSEEKQKFESQILKKDIRS